MQLGLARNIFVELLKNLTYHIITEAKKYARTLCRL